MELAKFDEPFSMTIRVHTQPVTVNIPENIKFVHCRINYSEDRIKTVNDINWVANGLYHVEIRIGTAFGLIILMTIFSNYSGIRSCLIL